MNKILLTIISFLVLYSCSHSKPLISKERCEQVCQFKDREYLYYDQERGCYCGSRSDLYMK